jgi:tRNA pseudouridine38-40 synthase
MRFFLEFAYDGTAYSGWQSQHNARSVQQVLQEALSTLLRQEIQVTGSGRTDAGVHASQQFAHFEWAEVLNTEQLVYRLNRLLPVDIAVYRLMPVAEDAHARFSALSRTYEYRISLQKDPFLRRHVLHFPKPLNVAAMNEAAAVLLKYEEFQSFCKTNSDTPHFKCTMKRAFWELRPDGLLVFTIEANRFLRGMVRLIVGSLLEVGTGKISVAQFQAIIERQDSRAAGSLAKACGLFLTQVEYPEGLL